MKISRNQTLSRDRFWWWDGHSWQPTLGTPAQAGRPPSGWRRRVPGFRRGSAWRMVVAVLGYLGIAATLATGLANLNLAGFLGELTALALLLLAADAFGVQSRIGILWAPAALALAALTVLLLAPEVSHGFQQGCQSRPGTCEAWKEQPGYVAGRLAIPLLLYLLPTVIALVRAVPDRWLAACINVLFGLTCIGWLAALALSLERRGNPVPVPLSGDRRWWWSGSRWIDSTAMPPPMAARTPDGAWWWNGVEWRPAATPPASAPTVATLGTG
ncbi:MAG: hypothetical protein DLM67_01630 [Candidatus Nephthysia bennettiae]|uniref:Superinfection immunity protein n=1 Tax=Candidatus Nephthysia bennettiae TaxID=3127016 RepID=A0A934K9L4_9BACT|nr:superinfection immunity protein [Candidatus Dormibacteraeota bacterium]MBJ7611523.1 superinfection immunity protein [Candidatus Dormibacteraeota bacterium]PZS00249.1 MAG: hypothetical protein DLM67_01630 [Candidatus Dormibacteraeota bacterium]